ncbi:MAG: shikimate kinase [Chloroflexi bacterium]|nr:shikimate kinase [Chloroflexota bacterium]
MGSKPNIYLIGLSGTGKTRSGRRLAEILRWPFVEMDGVVEDRAGKSILRIFEENGEEYFRDLESKILTEVAERGGRVVSTGGGVPVRADNRKTMKLSGMVVRLSASPEVIHRRLASSVSSRGRAGRPLLGADTSLETLRNMLREREEAYATADVTIDTEKKSHDQVAELIVAAWQANKMAAPGA